MGDKFLYNIKALKMIFVFENNLRRFIKLNLQNQFGENWESRLHDRILEHCRNQQEKTIKYLTNQELDDNILNHSFFSHLKMTISHFWNDVFLEKFSDIGRNDKECKTKVENKLFEIEVVRNLLSHSNLIDSNLITQLEANINFFKTYIPNYDENIYDINQNEKVINAQNIIDQILKQVRSKKNVEEKLISSSGIDDELTKLINRYNDIPKTRDKLSLVEEYIYKNKLIEKIKFYKV